MSAQESARILPMQTTGTQNFIERTYREGGQFQWVRETYVNAREAGATRIEFGLEWQAVKNKGVYRRLIADNGSGMNSDQLVEFFNTFGGGGKPIGGAHDNFGVGSKTSLLPWNHCGMVVISWVDGDASMIWVMRDPVTGEYGLKLEKCLSPAGEVRLESVYDPYDDPKHGCNWGTVKPDWIDDHGTVVVLLGDNPTSHTVLGDPDRDEASTKGISNFLNRRVWDIPDNIKVYVDELRSTERDGWPPSQEVGRGPVPDAGCRDRRMNMRRIEGARHFIEYPVDRNTIGKLAAKGTVTLHDATEIDWYLWDGERPKVSGYAAGGGYIAALYSNELYDVMAHHSTYRSFGVSESSVRTRLWLIIRPPVDPKAKHGVYPKTDRNSLLIKGGPNAGGPLPVNEWANEFADSMPDEILQALMMARKGDVGTITDAEWRERLAQRFGARWKLAKLRVRPGGKERLDSTLEGPPLRTPKNKPKPSSPTPGPDVPREPRPHSKPSAIVYGKPGSLSAEGAIVHVGDGLPNYRPVNSQDLEDGMIAAWQEKDPESPGGVVLINIDHPVLRSVIEHWQSQYADHHAEAIEKDVIAVYGQVAVSKVAHSEHLKGIVPSQIVEKDMRTAKALTMALLGLMAEDHLIATKVGGKYSKKRLPVAGQRGTQQPPQADQSTS